MKKYIILIPVYNDWKSVFKLLGEIDIEVAQLESEFSALIINDGSTEEMPKITGNYKKFKSINLINMKKNQGHARCNATGLKYLIDCLQKYKFEFPVSLTIIGHKYTGLKPDNIEIINPGIISEKSKINYLKKSDILCAPSLGNESFGIILLEAMASETVIIASNIDGYNNLNKHKKNGLLIKPKSSKSIYEAINSVYHNKKMKQEMIENGNNFIKNYGWDAISDKIIDIYRN